MIIGLDQKSDPLQPKPKDIGYTTRTDYEGFHPFIKVSVMGDREFCGTRMCRGDCGRPALFMKVYYDLSDPMEKSLAEFRKAQGDENGPYIEVRSQGSQVACGPMWEPHPGWTGEKVFLPDEYQVKNVYALWWW